MWGELTDGLSERELRGRPHPKANTIVWLVWHIARVEDVGVNRFVVDGRQVMDRDDWVTRLRVTRRDVGTGMTDAEVDGLSAAALAPKAQSTVFPWREPKDLLEKTIDQVRVFLRSHQPR